MKEIFQVTKIITIILLLSVNLNKQKTKEWFFVKNCIKSANSEIDWLKS